MNKFFAACLGACMFFSANSQNALDFDGTDDYVSTTAPGITGTNARTIEAWIKTSANYNPSASGTQGVIVDMGTMTNGQRFTMNLLWSNSLRIEIGGTGISGTTAVNNGQWHHVAVVYDPSQSTKVYLYIDGSLETSGNFASSVTFNTASGNIIIGRRIDNVNPFDGVIDEVRIWNVARSASEISNAMNSEFCSLPTGLVAYYKMNSGTAGGNNAGLTTAIDYASSNDGTLNNFNLSGSSSNWVTGKSLNTGSTSPGNVSITACDSYTANTGAIWTTSGNYVDTISSSTGCDSILNIALTINQSSTGSLTTTACNKYVSPSGTNTWTTSGTYTDTLMNAVGCDSVLTINLTVNTVDTSVLQNGIVLTSWATGVNYQWLDCNNGYAAVAGANSQTFVPTANGSYAVEIDDNGCIDTSACYTVTGIGFKEWQTNVFAISPNPVTSGKLSLTQYGSPQKGKLEIRTVSGQLVTEVDLVSRNEQEIEFIAPSGIYLITIIVGSEQYQQKIIVP